MVEQLWLISNHRKNNRNKGEDSSDIKKICHSWKNIWQKNIDYNLSFKKHWKAMYEIIADE